MKIIRPYATITNPAALQGALKGIEYAARISHRSEDKMTESTTERFIKAVVIDHGDWSVVEHVSASVEIITDRGITHEIVRHRIASYTQESTRFVNYEKHMPPSFIYPIPEVQCEKCLCGDQPSKFTDGWYHHALATEENKCVYDRNWLNIIDETEYVYKSLLAKGWRPQEARSMFPNALAAKILVTMNLRSWRHILLMRTTKEAHPQIREIMIPLLEQFKNLVPILFDDIQPLTRQADNARKGR